MQGMLLSIDSNTSAKRNENGCILIVCIFVQWQTQKFNLCGEHAENFDVEGHHLASSKDSIIKPFLGMTVA
jgi:hypothetical protein